MGGEAVGRVKRKYDDAHLPSDVKKYLAMKGQKSGQTAENYRHALHRYLASLRDAGKTLETMTEEDLIGFAGALAESGSPATAVSSTLKVLQPFFNWLSTQRGYDREELSIMVGYCKGMRVKPTGEHAYPALTAAQQDELFRRLENPYLRTIAWASIAYGFRAQEVCNLCMGDVQINESGVNDAGEPDWGRVVIRESKGNKTRSVYILKQHLPVWRFYLRLRARDEVPFENVFYWNHEPLTRSTYSEFFRVHIAGSVDFSMTSHSLRRTFGTNLLRQGVNLVVIQNLMGHTSLDVTRKYLNVLELETQQMYLESMSLADRRGGGTSKGTGRTIAASR